MWKLCPIILRHLKNGCIEMTAHKKTTLFRVALFVASPRIELGSGASETLILSIVLRGHKFGSYSIFANCKLSKLSTDFCAANVQEKI